MPNDDSEPCYWLGALLVALMLGMGCYGLYTAKAERADACHRAALASAKGEKL